MPDSYENDHDMDHENDNENDNGTLDRSRILEVPLQTAEILEIALDDLSDDADSVREIADLFTNERTSVAFWIKILDEYHRRGALETATQLGEAGVQAFKNRGDQKSTVPLLCMMASYAMAKARAAPKQVIPNPRAYTAKGDSKQVYFQKATQLVTQAEQIDGRNGFVLDMKANLYLLTGKYDEAGRIYDYISQQCPDHLFAAMGKARIHYMRRQFRQALKLYQGVLSASPKFLPDPRIGIGLSFWNLGEYDLARKAWERSRIVNPGKACTGASLLLGLSWINTAREPRLSEDERVDAYSTGIGYVQEAWSYDKTCAATAAALAGYFLTTSGKWDTVIKLAELTVQHADARAIISEGQLALARALHAQGHTDEATRHYSLAAEANPDQLVASLGVAQMNLLRKDYVTASNNLDNVVRKNPRCLEALIAFGAIQARQVLTQSMSGATAADVTKDRIAARETYDNVVTLFQGTADLKDGQGDQAGYLDPLGARIQQAARDPDLYIEIARLWTGDDLSKSLNAYRQSLSVRQDLDDAEAKHATTNGQNGDSHSTTTASSRLPQLLCNIGAQEFARGDYESAQDRFEQAITHEIERQQASAASLTNGATTAETDAVMMTLMYNLGIVMEARGQKEEAIQLYEHRLLARHPEFLEAKARLAAIALADKQYDRCSDFLKAALTAQPAHLDIRALYTYFSVEVNNLAGAKEFAVATLKDHNKTDTYAMSAMAHLLYQQARDSRASKPEEVKERLSRFYRANEAFDRVLQLDPTCAYAASGIAIALAENNLGSKVPTGQANLASNEAAQRSKNLRDALSILNKVREVANNGNVYVNIGLCHFQREEFERAIESLETANTRYYRNKHLPTLLYLSRARFHKAARDQSFAVLQDALASAQAAQALAPKDDAIRFNIALIQQRGLETLQELPASRRRVTEIQTAIAYAEIAQKTFGELADRKAENAPYNIDMADQRRKFIDTMLRRAPITLKEQEEWEQSEANKVEIARRDREAERARQAEVERTKREEVRRQADELASRRRQMAEDAKSWYVKPVVESEDDEDKPKRGKGRKKKEDDGIVPDGEGEEEVKPKKRKKAANGEGPGPKRKKKAKKEGSEEAGANGAGAGDSAPVSGGEDAEEDTGPKRAGGRKKKQYRTKEVISDSDVSD